MFEDLNYVKKLSGNNVFPIRAEVCYKYETLANSKICIREDLLETSTKAGVCVVNEAKVVYSSRAPVQVVSFREITMGKNKVMLEFTLRHDGNGRVWTAGSDCEYSLKDEDKVFVTVNTDLTGLKCSGLTGGGDESGYVKLFEGEAIVTCTQSVDTTTDFEKIVEIKLEYDYEDDKTVDLLVRESAEE